MSNTGPSAFNALCMVLLSLFPTNAKTPSSKYEVAFCFEKQSCVSLNE